MLECVVNISEGRDAATLGVLRAAGGAALLDVHTDPWHHRSVFTLVGEEAPRRLATAAISRLDIGRHDGVHPRIGVVDVVPFVPLDGSTMTDAERARDDFASWMTATHDVPCLTYGAERSLPDVRRLSRTVTGHPTAGACAVGARPVLVAYNLWVDAQLGEAKAAAAAVRGDGIRALGLQVGERVQVSMNLIEPDRVGPADVWDRVAAHVAVVGAELVGLVPGHVLRAIPEGRWAALDLALDRTIEVRLAERGAPPG